MFFSVWDGSKCGLNTAYQLSSGGRNGIGGGDELMHLTRLFPSFNQRSDVW